MKFFLPAAKDRAEADVILESIAKFIGVPLPKRRIFRLAYIHNGQRYEAEVGKPMAAYYETSKQPVVAILGEDPYCICLPDRGVLRGSPIYAGRMSVQRIDYFEFEGNELQGEP
ncbi:MAG: hypothetical protein ABL869_02445 [Candidatus Nitrotoga sp.]